MCVSVTWASKVESVSCHVISRNVACAMEFNTKNEWEIIGMLIIYDEIKIFGIDY